MDIKTLVTSRTFTFASTLTSTSSASPKPAFKSLPSKFVGFWREGHREARVDWHARWRSVSLSLAAIVWCVGLLSSVVVLNTLLTQGSIDLNAGSCQPDGSFTLIPNTYKYWTMSGIFEITLGWGELTFTQAKVIDVIWHIGIGRGGQALLTLISWSVFVRYVTTSMEVAPITLNTYRMIFLQNESLLLGIPRIIRDFTRRQRLQSKLAMVFMVMTMVFILVYPTLANAMVGYSGNVESYVKNRDNNFDAFNSFNIVVYTIHDGERINKTKDFAVTFPKQTYDQPLLNSISMPVYLAWRSDYNCEEKDTTRMVYPKAQCQQSQLVLNVSDYVGLHGFNGVEQTASKFRNFTLEAPVLNITASYVPDEGGIHSTAALNGSASFPKKGSFTDPTKMTWISSGGETYTMEEIKTRGSCQTVEHYKWGFSFIQLNIMMLLLILWSIGIVTMWAHAHATMKRRARTQVAGRYKAVLELSDAMRAQLVEAEDHDAGLQDVTESTLRRRINRDLRGGVIAYDASLLPEKQTGDPAQRGFAAWAKRERWWLGVLLLSVVVAVALGMCNFALLLAIWCALPAAMVFAMCVGSTARSRSVIVLWSFCLLCVIPAVVTSMYSMRSF